MLAGNREIKFRSFQAGLNAVLRDMEEGEIDELKAMVKKWNLNGPPDDEKQRFVPSPMLAKLLTFLLQACGQVGDEILPDICGEGLEAAGRTRVHFLGMPGQRWNVIRVEIRFQC